MSALGLHKLIPPGILAGRLVAVLVCYLDDSGKHAQSPITTVAGFVATAEQWLAFETQAEKIFSETGVTLLHATDMHSTKGEFEGWRILRKQAFVARLCGALKTHIPLAISMSAVKATYADAASRRDRKRTVTPYTFCTNLVLDRILRNPKVGRQANEDGIALVFETGHQNNEETRLNFEDVVALHGLDNVLKSVSFVGKASCRAIQMADLMAFYSRRHNSVEIELTVQERMTRQPEPMMRIIAESIDITSFVATDFP